MKSQGRIGSNDFYNAVKKKKKKKNLWRLLFDQAEQEKNQDL